MFKVVKERKLLMWTIFLIAALQMPQYALTTGIDLLHEKIFPDYSLATIQTVILLPSLLVAVFGVVAALLTRYYKISKKSSVIFGLALLALTGILPIFIHSEFWQLVVFSIIMGTGEGFLVPIAVSIMFDNFKEKERQFISGLQFSFVAGGCIFLSVVGGLLTRVIWYGGYILLILAIPVLLMALYSIPNDKKRLAARQEHQLVQKRTKLHTDVYYYSALAFIFLLLYTVTNSNLSSHLAEANLGDSAVTGVANAVMMTGGILMGIIFGKVSSIIKDHIITLSFVLIFVGYTVLNLLQNYLLADFIAVFIVGMTMSMIIPQCMFDISKHVDKTNSATATMIFSSIAPGFGGFLSAILFTNLTVLLGGDSTQFRYQFVGFVSLVAAVFVFFNTRRRAKKSEISQEKEMTPSQ